MSPPARTSKPFWIIPLLLGLAFLGWTQSQRLANLDKLSHLGSPVLRVDPKSPTGYVDGQRRLIVPGHNKESYQWIMQAQQMAATGQWRLRTVEYDNAPLGRPVLIPSLYCWWLVTVGWGHGLCNGLPTGAAIEEAARYADPLLHLLFIAGLSIFIGRRHGAWTTTLVMMAGLLLYPFAGSFLPGIPTDLGLSLVLAAGGLIPLITALQPMAEERPSPRLAFTLAGIASGTGVWLNPGLQVPVLLASGMGASLALWLRRTAAITSLPWRAWAGGGATTILLGYLLQNAPDRMSLTNLDFSENHPLYALGWLGAGEMLHALGRRWCGPAPVQIKRNIPLLLLAAAALLATPAIMLIKGHAGFLTKDTYATTLTNQGGWIEAESFGNLCARHGLALPIVSLLLPCLLLFTAAVQWWRQPGKRPALALAVVPVLTAIGYGFPQLSWWNVVGALLLGLVLVLATPTPGAPTTAETRILWLGGLAMILGPGLAALWPASRDIAPTKLELTAVAERDLAYWLAKRTKPDGAIVLAPPSLTISCLYHGGLRGLGTPYRENEEGFRASVRIAAATSADEAMTLARQRKLTHIAVPSWDNFLQIYARLGSNHPEQSLVGMMDRWLAPRWLRPIPYNLPKFTGVEDERLLVFEVTEVQDQTSSLSRLTEYFVEMGQTELATIAARTLASDYATDLGALVAKARADQARQDRAALRRTLTEIEKGLSDGSAENLLWDRRVSLCLVLAEGGLPHPAREQAQRCLEEMGELDLRSLSEATLLRFLLLCNKFSLEFPDASVRKAALDLLSPELRTQL